LQTPKLAAVNYQNRKDYSMPPSRTVAILVGSLEMGGLPLYNEDELKTLKTENARLKMLLSLP
jgi:hypothetical protein